MENAGAQITGALIWFQIAKISDEHALEFIVHQCIVLSLRAENESGVDWDDATNPGHADPAFGNLCPSSEPSISLKRISFQ